MHRFTSVLIALVVAVAALAVPSAVASAAPATAAEQAVAASANSAGARARVAGAPKAATKSPKRAISWKKARSHVGRTMKVCGPVVGTFTARNSKGKPTFLNIGKDYPSTRGITAIVWGRNVSKFPSHPAKRYKGRNVCVTGKIYKYNKYIQIEVKSPSRISIRR